MTNLKWIEQVGAQIWPVRNLKGEIVGWTVSVLNPPQPSIQPTRDTLKQALKAARRIYETNAR